MRREELAFAIDLAAREGWNPGLNDAECFFAPTRRISDRRAGWRTDRVHLGGFLCRALWVRRPLHRSPRVSRPGLRTEDVAGRHGPAAADTTSDWTASWPNRATTPSPGSASRIGTSAIGAGPNGRGTRLGRVRGRSGVRGDLRFRPASLSRTARSIPSRLADAAKGRGVRRQDGNRVTGYTVVRQCREGWKIGPLAAEAPIIARRLYDAAATHARAASRSFSMFRNAIRARRRSWPRSA